MVSSRPFAFAQNRAAAALRRSAVAGFLSTIIIAIPVQLDAAVDSHDAGHAGAGAIEFYLPALVDRLFGPVPGASLMMGATLTVAHAESIADRAGVDAVAGRGVTADLARPQPPDPSPGHPGFVERMRDWLARANREFQRTVVPRLSIPAPAGYSQSNARARDIEQIKDGDGDIAASIRRAEDALKSVKAKREAEARERERAAARAAEAKKAAELAEAQRAETARAEDSKRESERAAKLAKAESEALQREADRIKPDTDTAIRAANEAASAASAPEAAKIPMPEVTVPEDTARLAEDLRRERERIEAEVSRIERQRVDAETRRKAEEAQAREEERVRAAAKIAEEKVRIANLEAEKHSQRTVELIAEPIPVSEMRPVQTGVAPKPLTRVSSGIARGPVVKRWIRRSGRHSTCHFAGRKITPPGHYVVRRGDTLWGISRRHYRAGRHYMRIFRANRQLLRGRDLIYPCQRLYLPRRR